ncbi:MAG: sn-glycerol-1-phosphate dehydrogenase [Firmicutes bacterium]|nr:sn-glycerol-1-phosphate dehydrogenase [Bacillota bacterium]
MDISKMKLTDYLGAEFECECGKVHKTELETVEISAGALKKVAGIMRGHGLRKAFVVTDHNTYKVAGERLLSLLGEEEIGVASHVFDEPKLLPNEYAVGKLLLNFDSECDLIIAVGGGTINDLCRFVSFRLGIPYYIVATAPSTDGTASAGASLIVDNLKTSIQCQMPKAIIADSEILAGAPRAMIAAGFGDMVGKYTCLADWKLSAIINGEYYCDTVVDITRQSLERTVKLRHKIASGESGAVGELMEALVMAGIAMSFAGSSRPASGSEHLISHFWDLRFLLENKKGLLHGTQVSIAAVLVSKLYHFLIDEGLTSAEIAAKELPSSENWEEEIKRAYLDAAEEVLELEEKAQKNAAPGWKKRIKVIAEQWSEIAAVLESVPSAAEITSLIEDVGGVVNPGEVGIDAELVRQGILYAKDIRARYTILQLLWDLGLLPTYASKLVG